MYAYSKCMGFCKFDLYAMQFLTRLRIHLQKRRFCSEKNILTDENKNVKVSYQECIDGGPICLSEAMYSQV